MSYHHLYLSDSTQKQQLIDRFLIEKCKQGYWYCGVDSIVKDTAYIYLGTKIPRQKMVVAFSDDLNDAGSEIKFIIGKRWDHDWENLLSKYTDGGYPFAKVVWDSINIEQGNAQAHLVSGPHITFDSIKTVSLSPLSKTFLQLASDIPFEEEFSESKFGAIPARIERLDGVKLATAPQLLFVDNKASILLDLQSENNSSFEGLVGLQSSADKTQQTSFTGYLNLHLGNLFKSSKLLDFEWNKFANQSQTADIHYQHPYLMGAPIALDFRFGLIKQDTSFLSQNTQLLFNVFVWKKADLIIGFQRNSGFLVSPESINLEQGFADYQSKKYHLGIKDSKFSKPEYFGSFFHYYADLAIGDKSISRNSALDPSIYDQTRLKTLLLQAKFEMRYQQPLLKQLAFHHRISSGSLINDAVLTNELERLGGFRSVRGFNEKTYYAQHYLTSNAELRQYFGQASYLMLIYDLGWLQDHKSEQFILQGIGAGLTLQTSNGLFTFATALGRASNTSLNPAALKVHLGYISLF